MLTYIIDGKNLWKKQQWDKGQGAELFKGMKDNFTYMIKSRVAKIEIFNFIFAIYKIVTPHLRELMKSKIHLIAIAMNCLSGKDKERWDILYEKK